MPAESDRPRITHYWVRFAGAFLSGLLIGGGACAQSP